MVLQSTQSPMAKSVYQGGNVCDADDY